MKLEYSSNNSGGGWWLSDEDWYAMERAGWTVNWKKGGKYADADGRWLGALATDATIEVPAGKTGDELIAEWEQITGQCADDEGCECCGRPHYFYEVAR